jgi:N utilization substance protein A
MKWVSSVNPLFFVSGHSAIMNSEILAGLDFFERDKGIKREVLLEAINNALLTAARKAVGPARELRVEIDPKSGNIKALAKLIVVEKVVNKHDEVSLTEARKKVKPDAQIGEELDILVTPKDFGRIAAQTARQAINQRLRQAEREMIYEEFRDRAGEIITGTVRRFDRSDVIVDLGKFEGVMPNRERVATEEYSVGDRIRAYVVAVENGIRGPEIILSRSHPNFVRRLFETEVAEIADRTVEIKGIAREAGHRTKIAVWSANEKVDPVGACVGMRGARVKNIVRELNNEKVDIIRWSSDVKELVLEALKPAKIKSITLDEAKRNVQIKVEADQLSLAIGKRGQNARLTSRLTGWDISIDRDESVREAFEQNVEKGAVALAASLGVDLDIARKLTMAGMAFVEVIAPSTAAQIAEAIECDEALAEQILAAAQREMEKANA